MDELLQRVAEIKGMPASLVERSAQARAEKEGTTVEAVLQEWAGEAVEEPSESAPTTDEGSQATDDSPGDEPAEEQAAAPVEITTDYLVQLAADAKRMPPKLILSSATARAEHGNTSLESVLADWAGADLEELKSQESKVKSQESRVKSQEPAADEQETVSPEPAAAPAVAAAAAGAMTMDELLDKVAEVKGMPASLAKRSAEARSKKTGEPVEAVLAEWAGVDVDSITVDAAPTTEPKPDAGQEAAEATSEAPQETDEPSGPEIIEAESPVLEEPSEDDEPAARGRYPRWLAAAFVLIPLLAVVYILVTPNGPDCGVAGQLAIDPATGQAVNCDGSEYGVSAADYFSDGAGLYNQCVACHSADGSGGAGPSFAAGALLTTFPAESCNDQIEWIRLGTAGWSDPTYGATSKPVGGFGLMPSFGSAMTDEQLASVALYERVQFGGQPLEEAEIDCGLVVPGDETVEAAGS